MKGRGCSISMVAVGLFMLSYLMMPPSPIRSWMLVGLIYLVLPAGVCLAIVDFAQRKQVPKDLASLEPLRERLVTERVLVICPFCGTKNEQGITTCRNCGAEV